MFKCIKQLVGSKQLSLVKQNFHIFRRNIFRKNIENESTLKSLGKPLIFTIGFSATTITCCTICEYESSINDINSKHDIWRKFLYTDQRATHNDVINQVKNWWNTRTDAFRIFVEIAAINVLVFCAWKVKPFQRFMSSYFMMHSDAKIFKVRSLSLLLATFSHYSIIHLSLNLVVLYSLSDIAVHLYGKHQFISLYLCSGVISSFIGYAFKILTSRKASSLGASGAILGILSACCITEPNLEFMVIFFPFITFTSGAALKGLILFDIIGLLFKFRVFDHASHLGGTFTGLLYAFCSEELSTKYKKEVINQWRSIKTYIRR